MSETKDVCISRYQTEHSFKWKWPKNFAGSWQHLLETDKKNSENGVPSLSFLILFSTKLLSTTPAMLVCTFGVAKQLLLQLSKVSVYAT
jgi:hypothetical protein